MEGLGSPPLSLKPLFAPPQPSYYFYRRNSKRFSKKHLRKTYFYVFPGGPEYSGPTPGSPEFLDQFRGDPKKTLGRGFGMDPESSGKFRTPGIDPEFSG